MDEPTITCPKCNVEIKLTEPLAASLFELTRREPQKQDNQIIKHERACLPICCVCIGTLLSQLELNP